jgi:hypothetical protein
MSEATVLWQHLHPDNKPPAITGYPLEDLVQRASSGIVHFVQRDLDVQLLFLRCGKPVADRYNKVIHQDPIEWPMCRVCEANWKASV